MDRSSCLLVVASLVLGFSGCTSCHHQAIRPVIEPLQNTALCGEQRSQVYTFLVNGNDPLILAELYQLRGKLNEYGFTKIYSGELFHGALFEKEIRRLQLLVSQRSQDTLVRAQDQQAALKQNADGNGQASPLDAAA